MKAKFMVIALTGLFALSLTACDRNKHPASDNAHDTTTANTLNYDRNNTATTDTAITQSDTNSPGHGPVPTDDADNNAASDNTDDAAYSTTDDISNSNPTANR